MQNYGRKGAWPRSRDLLLNFGTLSISGYLTFAEQIDYDQYYTNNAKLVTKRTWPRSRDLLLNFGAPVYLRNGKDGHLKFGVLLIDYNEYYSRKAKLWV